MGVASLVLGIISLVVAWIPCVGWFALLPALIGTILGAIGWKKACANKQPAGISIAGFVCSLIALILAIVWTIGMASVASETAQLVGMAL